LKFEIKQNFHKPNPSLFSLSPLLSFFSSSLSIPTKKEKQNCIHGRREKEDRLHKNIQEEEELRRLAISSIIISLSISLSLALSLLYRKILWFLIFFSKSPLIVKSSSLFLCYVGIYLPLSILYGVVSVLYMHIMCSIKCCYRTRTETDVNMAFNQEGFFHFGVTEH
jgi:hypothetical protein